MKGPATKISAARGVSLGARLFLSSVLLVAASYEKDRVGRTGARVLSDGDHKGGRRREGGNARRGVADR